MNQNEINTLIKTLIKTLELQANVLTELADMSITIKAGIKVIMFILGILTAAVIFK